MTATTATATIGFYMVGCVYVNESGEEVQIRDWAILTDGRVLHDDEAREAVEQAAKLEGAFNV